MTALDQRTGHADRVLVHLGIRDLVRHEHGILVCNEEVHVLRQIALGNADDIHAEYLAAHALGDGLTRQHVHACKLVRSAHQLVHFAGQIQIAVVVRHERIIERLRSIRNLADDIRLGRLCTFHNAARHGDKALECVFVRRRRGLLIQLQAQHVGGVLDQILIEVVALVDGQGKRLVLRHGQFLHHVLHLGHIAVALETAVTVVIDLLHRDRGVNLERFHAGQVIRLRGFALDEGRTGEYLRNLVGILACEIDSHKNLPPT